MQQHPVIFCGAGPGDPELITVKGQKALQQADLVVYAGSLVPEELLKWTRCEADRISSANMTLDQIVAAMVEAYAAGRRVVRLHTGDPSLYGAIHEQMVALQARSIPYEVIPGVTAAFAAAAAMGIEYTLPETTQTLILTRMAGRTPVPESEKLETLASHKAAMAIYLSLAMIDQVAAVLATHYGPDALCAVAYKVSHPQEKIVTTPIHRLVQTVQENNIHRQALIIVGPAVALHHCGTVDLRSQLYAPEFSHGYRSV